MSRDARRDTRREDGGLPPSLEQFLARASVRDRYPHYDLGAAEARLLRGGAFARAPKPPGNRRAAPAPCRR
ncbi:hypothetical protein, partial [Streptomyces sp. NPDC060049]|uniref:hypothetical protein n=1 Tax=Streptomyces sp. NPDC060049 TaxID=3347046 RepID=UPI0036A91A81